MQVSHLVATARDHSGRLESDLQMRVAKILADNPAFTPAQAMLRAQKELWEENCGPYLPPKDGRCIINTIPAEILAHIFRLGVEIDRFGPDDQDFEEVDHPDERAALEGSASSTVRIDEDDEEVIDVIDVPDAEDGEWEDEDSASESDDDEHHHHHHDGSCCSDSHSDDDEEDDDEEEEMDFPFELLVSAVCKFWRETALSTPDLWNSILFEAPPQWDKYTAYLTRAKGQPLVLDINGTRDEDADTHPDHPDYDPDYNPDSDSDDDEDSSSSTRPRDPPRFFSRQELERIMDLIVPYAAQWQKLDIEMEDSINMDMVLAHLAAVPEAPMLEFLHLNDVEACEDYEIDEGEDHGDDEEAAAAASAARTARQNRLQNPPLPFHGNAPKLESIFLWGAHIDWDGSVAFMRGLRELSLHFHERRPSFRTFRAYLDNSPGLLSLELECSGPALGAASDGFGFGMFGMNGGPPLTTPNTGLPTAYYTPLENTEQQQPGGTDAPGGGGDPYEWPRQPVEVPSLECLALSQHRPHYATLLATSFSFPNLQSLSLQYEQDDYTPVADAYLAPVPHATSRRSVFQTIRTLRLLDLGWMGGGLAEQEDKVRQIIHSLEGLERLELKGAGDEVSPVPSMIWEIMKENAEAVSKALKAKAKEVLSSAEDNTPMEVDSDAVPTAAAAATATAAATTIPPVLFPHTTHLETRKIPGADLKRYIAARTLAFQHQLTPAPVKILLMEHTAAEQGLLSWKHERWFRENVPQFGFYDDDLDEEEEEEDDEEDEEEEDGSEGGGGLFAGLLGAGIVHHEIGVDDDDESDWVSDSDDAPDQEEEEGEWSDEDGEDSADELNLRDDMVVDKDAGAKRVAPSQNAPAAASSSGAVSGSVTERVGDLD